MRDKTATAWGWIFTSVFTALFVIPTGWVAEDPYIIFRVIDNFVQGYGLRWNVDERVQAYTNPLWTLLHIPVYAVAGNMYLTTLGLSFVFSFIGIGLMLLATPKLRLGAILVLCTLLACSNAFRDYTSSGMETPLVIFLWAWFAYVAIKKPSDYWFQLSVVTALSYVNRMDTILTLMPALLYMAYQDRRNLPWRDIALGALPAVAWSLFALFYYGFFLPNTRYAKLTPGMPLFLYFKQGTAYYYNLLIRDSVTFFTLVAGFHLTVYFIVRAFERWHNGSRQREDHNMLCMFGLGATLYCAYILYVGGDYMSGRLFLPPLCIFATIIYQLLSGPVPVYRLTLIALGVLLLKFCNYHFYQFSLPNDSSTHATQNSGIVDERLWHLGRSGLWSHPRRFMRITPSVHPADFKGRRIAKNPNRIYKVVVHPFIGQFGFYSGPRLTIIDPYGLPDALIARLPYSLRRDWKIGHLARDIPPGYIRARKTGDTDQMPPPLARYYEKLRLVTSGNIFNFERLKTIAGFQLGLYDHWLDEYASGRK